MEILYEKEPIFRNGLMNESALLKSINRHFSIYIELIRKSINI
jgi:hypothetical protein